MNIYLLTSNPYVVKLVSNTNLELTSYEDIIKFLESNPVLDLDIETTGLDPHKDEIKTIQIRHKNNCYLIDCFSYPVQHFKSYLESALLIGHNLKFDLQFFYTAGVFPTKVYDTYIAETVLYLGDDLRRKGLADCVYRYFGVVLDKTEQSNIQRTFTLPFLKYAAMDVFYLSEIKAEQEKRIEEKQCKVTIELNNRFVKVLAYTEWCGLKLDSYKWSLKTENSKKLLLEVKDKLDKFILDNNITQFINPQMTMFDSNRVNINWNSSDQVAEIFKFLKLDITNKVDGEIKESVSESVIGKYKNIPFVKDYLYYKELQKDISTYGDNWLKMLNPVTGRIHTSFKQLVNTSRMASGSKKDKTKPNLQNIPSDEETRSCFVAEDQNVIVGCDYSQQEQVVLANKSLDENLLEFFDKDIGDMHSFVGFKMYGNPESSLYVKEVDGLDLKEFKNRFPDLRNKAKMAGFTINYGGTGEGMAKKLNIPTEQGVAIYNSYFEVFPKMKQFFEDAKKKGLEKGYITISEITGLKYYIPDWEKLVATKKAMDSTFWERYKKLKNEKTPTAQELQKRVKDYFQSMSSIEKASLNYPIQGESAEMTKLAGIYFFEKYILPNNLFGLVKIVNFIHDEILIEGPGTMKEELADNLKKAMLDSADKFCKRVRMKATPTISTHWQK